MQQTHFSVEYRFCNYSWDRSLSILAILVLDPKKWDTQYEFPSLRNLGGEVIWSAFIKYTWQWSTVLGDLVLFIDTNDNLN